MTINVFQAVILGIFACLASLPGMGGTTIGNYTLGRPLVGGLICGIILGNVQLGIIVGAAIQVVYIALVTLAELSRLMSVPSPTSASPSPCSSSAPRASTRAALRPLARLQPSAPSSAPSSSMAPLR